MGIPMPNMNEVEGKTAGGKMPAGWNRCKVEVADEGQSKKGDPQIALEFSGRHGSVRDWITFTEKALPFVKSKLEAMGVEWPDGPFELNAAALKGKTVDLLIDHEPGVTKDGNPTTYARVKAYRAAEGEDPTPSTASAPPPQQSNPVGTVPPSPAYDEDAIPF